MSALFAVILIGMFLWFVSPHPSKYATIGTALQNAGLLAIAVAHWWINRGRGLDMEPGPWFYGSMCVLASFFGYLQRFCWDEPKRAWISAAIAVGCAVRAAQRRSRIVRNTV
jgi:hypothetical protein